MDRRKRNYILYKNLKLFGVVLLVVLFCGTIVLGISYKKQQSKEKLQVYEFFQLPQSEEEKFANTSLETEMDLNRDIYQTAVENGERVKMVPCVDEESVTLLFAGDILLDDTYAMMSNYVSRGRSMENTFAGGLLEQMRLADVFMVNNEFTFTDRGTPTKGKLYTFRSKPENVQFLSDMGVDIVSLANNHSYDFGEVSLLDTLETLEKADMPYVGAGRNLDEAKEPYYLVANGMKIAFVSGTQLEKYANPETKGATLDSAGTLRCVDPVDLLKSIEIAEQNADMTILFIHWGTESKEWIDEMQQEQAKLYTQAGVDLIIGAHPHVLQQIDFVNDVPVVYSLGNFWFNSKDRDTGMVQVTLKDKEIVELRFIPCKQTDCKTVLLDGVEKQRVIQNMRTMSPDIIIDENGLITQR